MSTALSLSFAFFALPALAEDTVATDSLPVAYASAEQSTVPAYQEVSARSGKRKIPALAAGLNFFIPGTGYIYNGERRLMGAAFATGVVGLTVVEQSSAFGFEPGLKDSNPDLFNIMFASVFLMNTAFAWDAWREAKEINTASAALTPERGTTVAVAPASYQVDGKQAMGLSLNVQR